MNTISKAIIITLIGWIIQIINILCHTPNISLLLFLLATVVTALIVVGTPAPKNKKERSLWKEAVIGATWVGGVGLIGCFATETMFIIGLLAAGTVATIIELILPI